MQRFSKHIAFILLVVAALSSEAAPPSQVPPGAVPPLVFDNCAEANPDAVLFVPETFTNAVFKSGSGGYFYRDPEPYIFRRPCNFFIVDVHMATYSNRQPAPEGSPSMVYVTYEPFDIPGSEAYGEIRPVGMEDCKRLTAFARFYVRKSGETQFTFLQAETANSHWTTGGDGKCILQASPKVASPSASGWDTYRFAVAIKERSSGQEVQVIIDQPPPK